ncbi:hypothetical protein E2562_034438 [Oryza meyeriana var. granulata]|uniref:Uncharacterized protein n=1 Tax=Oryza meyeriana var. granulata TaxID=110450 RepID=A0A6G1FFJ1_9ORYZ|nr:hypothetical protein E2562_034438 [Oryza meyeriana var. granulata]
MRRYYHPAPKRNLEGAASTPTGPQKKANVTNKFNPDGTTSDLRRHRPIDEHRWETKDKAGGAGLFGQLCDATLIIKVTKPRTLSIGTAM